MVYVEDVQLDEQEIRLRFNPCDKKADCEPFHVQIVIMQGDTTVHQWEDEAFTFEGKDLVLTLPELMRDYQVQMLIDGELAYAGDHQPQLILL